MNTKKRVLVTGATGQQGGAVVNALLRAEYSVVGMTRNPDSEKALDLKNKGVEIVSGNFTDLVSLYSAVKSVDVVFAMSTPFEQGTDAETAQCKALVQVVADAGVEHLVFNSVGSADQNTGIPHFDSKYRVELFIKEVGINATIVAPVFFMDNLKSPWIVPSLKNGVLTQALPDKRRLQMISVKSIGEFVAEIIKRGPLEYKKRYDLAEDELDGIEAASILSKVTGKEITYKGFPPLALKEQSEDMAIMYEWFDKVGYSVKMTSLREQFSNVGWTDFSDWAAAQDWSILDQ